MKRKVAVAKGLSLPVKPAPKGLLTDLRTLIHATRQTVAQTVNSALVLLYWQIGQRILTDILKAKRAPYGGEILQTVSAKLTLEFGRGFSQRNLALMVPLAGAMRTTVQSDAAGAWPVRQLAWLGKILLTRSPGKVRTRRSI